MYIHIQVYMYLYLYMYVHYTHTYIYVCICIMNIHTRKNDRQMHFMRSGFKCLFDSVLYTVHILEQIWHANARLWTGHVVIGDFTNNTVFKFFELKNCFKLYLRYRLFT